MNDQSKSSRIDLSAFDALRLKQSLKEQNAILESLFPDASSHHKTNPSVTMSSDLDQDQVAQLYKSFQQTRIPNREKNIDAILSEFASTKSRGLTASNISLFPSKTSASDGVSSKVQYFATAATLVLSLCAMLFLSNSHQRTDTIEYALSQLTQTHYSGELLSITATHPVFAFSSKANSGSEAFIVGVSSIDLPVLLASNRNKEADNLILQLERLARDTNKTLIPHLITLTKNRPFDITYFQTTLKSEISAIQLDERQIGFYKLGRWVESCILATEVAIQNKDYSLLNTLLKRKPATSDNFPHEINHLLKSHHTVIGTTDQRSKARENYRQLMLIKGYF